MERILIVRLGAMGDVIHALPAVAALRAGLPGVQIGWVIEERWADLLAAPGATGPAGTPQKPLVDRLHLVDTRAWRAAPLSDETWSELRSAHADLTAARYDAAIDFQGLLKSAVFAQLSGAPTRIGFADPKERIATMFYTRTVDCMQEHVVDRNVELTAALPGYRPVPADLVGKGPLMGDGYRMWHPKSLDLPTDEAAEQWCEAELRRRGIGSFVLISPGAGWGAKLWPVARYGEVAQALAQDGLSVLVNFGPGEEPLAHAVVDASGGGAQGLQCSVSELIALTRRAKLFIGSDSGPLHLAAALDVPLIALFGPTDPRRNGPRTDRRIMFRAAESETSYAHVATPDEGLSRLPASQIINAALSLLKRSNG
jgi:lipopolysaccharide heptosyltransferase I